jgi:hypothetical protein
VKNYFLAIFIILCIISCRKKERKPDYIYSEQAVAAFLLDLYILESKVKDLGLDKDSLKIIFRHYEQQLYEKHELNDSLYQISFNYYLNDPDGLTEIYTALVDSLSLRERLLHSAPENPDDY